MNDPEPLELPDLDALEGEADALSRGAIVAKASPGRTGKQRRHLRSLGHSLKATVQVGHQGPTASVAGALDRELLQRELVKVRLLESAPCSVGAAALWLHAVTGADVVQLLGRTLLAYRPHPDKPEIRLPKSPAEDG